MCKISVIIPVYNSENYIEDTLCCVCNQSLSDIEIICINDGSTDRSDQIIKKKMKDDSRIKYLYQENRGAGAARNNGMSVAKGEYIAFIDSDDKYPDINTLKTLYEAAINNKALICGGSAVSCSNEKLNSKYTFTQNGFVDFSEYQFPYFFVRFIFNNIFIRENNLYFPELRVFEDPVFLAKAMMKAKRFFAISNCVYVYTGAHQASSMALNKTIDYLSGLIMCLKISSEYGFKELHNNIHNKLETDAGYYAEQYLYSDDCSIYALILEANANINRELLDLDNNYVLPALVTLRTAAKKYMRLRNNKFFKLFH